MKVCFSRYASSVAIAAVLLASCGGSQSPTGAPGAAPLVPVANRNGSQLLVLSRSLSSQKIRHVVIIFQENRTTNNLFNGLPGANTVRVGMNSQGKQVQLQPVSLTAPYDISHHHNAYLTEYANGKLNGWDLVSSTCSPNRTCPPKDVRAYGYVPEKQVEPYFVMAKQYVFGANMFQTNQGPSFPAHQYILSGTSTISDGSHLRAAENAHAPAGGNAGGCDSPQGSLVRLIDQYGQENQWMYPCFDRNSLIALIDAKSLTWHYYQAHPGPGLWRGPDAIKAVFNSPEFANDVVSPPSQILTDIASGHLANVAWVTPTSLASDHAVSTDGTGPSWVAAVVNAIGQSSYWNNTAIFVTWDDWGGWFDPVTPHQYNSYELGFRVPLLVISAYSKQHYISTKQHEFGSILKFTEKLFNLPSLGTTDVRADDLSDCFDFSKGPQKFSKIPAPQDSKYFLKQPLSNESPDSDF